MKDVRGGATGEERMPKHILAVDDEMPIRRLVQINLQRAGYRVTMACDGQEALLKMQADPVDLLVLDIGMPNMDGLELLRRLKADPETAGMPIILLTGKKRDGDVVEGWHAGADSYLTKPFHPTELLATVQQLLPAAE